MPNDALEDLLARTDTLLPPPSTARATVDRIRARAARRTRTRLAAAALVLIVATVLAGHQSHPHPRLAKRPSPAAPSLDIAAMNAELARLDYIASVHQRAAEQIARLDREQASSNRAAASALLFDRDPLAPLSEARDRAARIMLLDGDRLERTPGKQARAQAIYLRAVQLFLDTPAARQAADRLKYPGASL